MKTRSHIFYFGLLTAALTLVATVLRSLSFALSFDTAVDYFDAGIFPTLLYIVIALALAAAFAYAIYLHRQTKKGETCPRVSVMGRRPLALRVTSALVVFAALLLVLIELPMILSGYPFSLVHLRALVALAAIPFFVLPLSRRTALFGILVEALCILLLCSEYFDRYVTTNSPIKLMQQVAFLAVMLYMLTELYALVDVEQPRRARIIGALAVFFTLTNGISNTVAFILGDILTLDYLIRSLFLLAMGLYIGARLACATPTPLCNKEES